MTYDLRFENAYSGFLQKTEQTLWEGRSVDEIVTLQATMHGGWIKNPISAVGVIYNRSESGFTVQFQAHDGMRKAVRAHFRQVGDDIAAYVDNCGWDGVFPTGTLMDDAKFTESAATAANGSGYGVYDIVAGVAETVAGLPEDAESITVNVGRLTVETGADLSVAVPVSGDGFIEFKGTGETSGNFTFGKFLTAQDQVVATDTPISALSVTAGEMGGAWCNSSGTLNLEPIQLQWNDERTSFTVQFHWMNDKGYLKAVCAQFSQSGLNVVGKVIKAAQGKAAGLGTDMLTDMVNWPESGTDIATAANASGYGLADFAYTVTRPPVVDWSGGKSLTGGMVVNACAVAISGSHVAPKSTVTLKNGGSLYLHAKGTPDGAQFVTYTLEEGTVLYMDGGYALSNGDRLFMDRATLNWAGASSAYFNAVTANGDCRIDATTGKSFGVGYKGNATWSASGDGELVVDGRVILTSATRTFSIEANEVIRFRDLVRDHSTEIGMAMRKSGTAAAIFEKGVQFTGTLIVESGMMEFNADASFGALRIGEGESVVSVAAGQSLSFADSSSATWGEGRVAFECAEGATVRFGDSGDALTRAQLRRIRLNGEKVVLDESGALMPRGKTGFRLILR